MKGYDGCKAIVKKIRALTAGKSNLVFVSGNFNILHSGHLRLLRFARSCGDCLIVGVQSDRIAGDDVCVKAELRQEALESINCVDYSFIMDCRPSELIKELKPAIVVKGKEHENMPNPEEKIISGYGGKLLFSSGDVVFSSLELLRNEYSKGMPSEIQKSPDYLKRHGICNSMLRNTIDRFSGLKVIVVGDSIVDEYITCDPIGMSREEPTVVVTPLFSERFIGGAAIVAGHAASLGASVSFFSVAGKDEHADFIRSRLSENNINGRLFTDSTRPTTLKQRYRADGRSLLRINVLRQHEIAKDISDQFKRAVFEVLPSADLLVFSDFNYGCLPQGLVDDIIRGCRKYKIPFVADSQSSSQTGDISRFRNAELLTPTEHELRIAIQDSRSGIVTVAEKLRKKTGAKNIFVTLGKEGLFIHNGQGKLWLNDRLPAMNSNPKDVAGAGDSLLISAALALAADADIWASAYIGSVAAACQVARVGNTPLCANLLKNEISP